MIIDEDYIVDLRTDSGKVLGVNIRVNPDSPNAVGRNIHYSRVRSLEIATLWALKQIPVRNIGSIDVDYMNKQAPEGYVYNEQFDRYERKTDVSTR